MAYGKGFWKKGYKPTQDDYDQLAKGEWPEGYHPTQEEYDAHHAGVALEGVPAEANKNASDEAKNTNDESHD